MSFFCDYCEICHPLTFIRCINCNKCHIIFEKDFCEVCEKCYDKQITKHCDKCNECHALKNSEWCDKCYRHFPPLDFIDHYNFCDSVDKLFCIACENYFFKYEEKHCEICETCHNIDYIFCEFCRKCVDTSSIHCSICDKCHFSN